MQPLSNNAFSIRRLNPFNGLLQVYQIDSARALSANGRTWEIQVLSEAPQGLWANTPLGTQQYFTFGLWSKNAGLKQVPVNPLFDIRTMITASDRLIENLEAELPYLPFPMTDCYECWLLDEANQSPLALLQSCRTEDEIGLSRKTAKWFAAEQDDCRFVSAHLTQRGLPNNDGFNPRVHASVLEAEVQHRAGSQPNTGWFFRSSENEMMSFDKQQLHELSFPTLPLAESGYDAENHTLIEEYITWKSPQLLMLPYLSSDSRQRLEQLAIKQAEQIDRYWTLYPEIHNKDLLKRARVEARIRSAGQSY
ncbi:MAG: hypothetical protein P8163_03250 [Candidatus Thiodiazotropha sp.]